MLLVLLCCCLGFGRLGGEEEGNRNDNVGSNQHGTLEPVGLAVTNNVVENHDRHEKNAGLKGAEQKTHGLSHNPAKNDEEGSQEEGNLQGRANGNTDSKVHLVLHGNDNCGDVLSGVADNGDEDKTNEGLGDTSSFDNVINGVNQVVGTVGNDNGYNGQHDSCLNSVESGSVALFFVVIVFFDSMTRGGSIGLNINMRVNVSGLEIRGMGVKLENQVEDVNRQQDQRSASRDIENVLKLVGVAGVEGGGDEQGGDGKGHHGSHGLGHDGVELLRGILETTGQETASHDEQDV